MAKRPVEEGMPDETKQGADYLPPGKESGRIVASGVGLRERELEEIQRLAQELGITANALTRLAVRYFLLEVHAGRLDPQKFVEIPKPKPRVKY